MVQLESGYPVDSSARVKSHRRQSRDKSPSGKFRSHPVDSSVESVHPGGSSARVKSHRRQVRSPSRLLS